MHLDGLILILIVFFASYSTTMQSHYTIIAVFTLSQRGKYKKQKNPNLNLIKMRKIMYIVQMLNTCCEPKIVL